MTHVWNFQIDHIIKPIFNNVMMSMEKKQRENRRN